MLNETLNHPRLLLIFLCLGLVGGVVFDVANFIKFLFANKKASNFVLDFFATSACVLLLLWTNLKVNFGLLRLFPAVIFLSAFALERFTLGKLIAKIYLTCYNFLVKLNNKIWSKRKNAKTDKNS